MIVTSSKLVGVTISMDPFGAARAGSLSSPLRISFAGEANDEVVALALLRRSARFLAGDDRFDQGINVFDFDPITRDGGAVGIDLQLRRPDGPRLSRPRRWPTTAPIRSAVSHFVADPPPGLGRCRYYTVSGHCFVCEIEKRRGLVRSRIRSDHRS